jgi:hypothetical protein
LLQILVIALIWGLVCPASLTIAYSFETRVFNPKPKFLRVHMSSPTTHHYMPNKKTEKGDSLHSPGHTMGRAREIIQPIFGHLQGTDMRFSFKYTKNMGREQKIFILKQFQSRGFQ